MLKITKICLFIALFLVSASIAWAGFNYNSASNYFLIDSTFKLGGNYIIIGDALSGYCSNLNFLTQSQCQSNGSVWHEVLKKHDGTESSDFFAISNNLIFVNPDGVFCTYINPTDQSCTGSREIDKNNFSTSAITINSDANDLEIMPRGLAGALTLAANKITINQDLILNSGLSMIANTNPVSNTIQVERVLTNKIGLLDSTLNELAIDGNTDLTIAAGGTATASSIIYKVEEVIDNKPFCEIKEWAADDNIDNATAEGAGKKDTQNPACTVSNSLAKKTCCDPDYFIYDYDATAGKMVCCRFRGAPPPP
jgi:hypothetical protein